MVLGKLNLLTQKNGIGPLSCTIYKNQLKWIKDINVRPAIVELLKQNIENKILDIGLGNDFMNMTPKSQ